MIDKPFLKLAVSRRRVLRFQLRGIPLVGERHDGAADDWHRLPRWHLGAAAVVARRVRVDESRKVCRSLGSRHGGQRVTPEHGEELKGRHKLADATMLARANLVSPVEHPFRRHPVSVVARPGQRTWVVTHDVPLDHVAGVVEAQAVDGAELEDPRRVGDLVRLNELDVQLHAVEPRVALQHRERFAVGRSGSPHDPQLAWEVDRVHPVLDGTLNTLQLVVVGVLDVQLQPRAGADHVTGERGEHAGEVGVIGGLIAAADAKRPADAGVEGRIGRQPV